MFSAAFLLHFITFQNRNKDEAKKTGDGFACQSIQGRRQLYAAAFPVASVFRSLGSSPAFLSLAGSVFVNEPGDSVKQQ
jgi:hypothetical protein